MEVEMTFRYLAILAMQLVLAGAPGANAAETGATSRWLEGQYVPSVAFAVRRLGCDMQSLASGFGCSSREPLVIARAAQTRIMAALAQGTGRSSRLRLLGPGLALGALLGALG